MTIGQQLSKMLSCIGRKDGIPCPDKTTTGAILFRIFCWQEISRFAETNLKQAWSDAQHKVTGICDPDDVLRTGDVGQRELTSSRTFSLVVELKTPASRVDTEDFYKALAKRFKTTVAEIEAIAERNKVDSKPSLSKKVVERIRETADA